MILRTVQVEKYKCVNDSTPFKLDSDVTCLVGKNEAGKTAILEALHKLKPVRAEDGHFDYVREYFKPEMLDYELRHKTKPERVITTKWELEEEDYVQLERLIGTAARQVGPVTAYKRWDNKTGVEFHLDESEVVQGLLSASDVEAKDLSTLNAKTVQELVGQLGATPEEQQQRNAL